MNRRRRLIKISSYSYFIFLFTILSISSVPLGLYIRILRLFKSYGSNFKTRVVLYADYMDGVNGISRYTLTLFANLKNSPVNFYLISCLNKLNSKVLLKSDRRILIKNKIKIQLAHYNKLEIHLPPTTTIFGIFLRIKPHFVELQTPSPGSLIILMLSKVAGIRVISNYRTDVVSFLECQNTHPLITILTKFWVYLILTNSEFIIAPTESVKRKVVADFCINHKKIKVLRRGVDLTHFSPKLQNAPSITQKPELDEISYLYVGRISIEKDLDFLAEVWIQFITKETNTLLTIVGDGPYLPELKKKLILCNNVCYIGFTSGPELVSLYQNASYFLFPSGFDTFGNVVVESLACGTPSIVSNKGGPKEIVEHKHSGWVVSYKCKSSWLTHMQIANNLEDNKQKKLRNAARKRAFDFNFNNTRKDIAAFYLNFPE